MRALTDRPALCLLLGLSLPPSNAVEASPPQDSERTTATDERVPTPATAAPADERTGIERPGAGRPDPGRAVARALSRASGRVARRLEAARPDLFVDHSSWDDPWIVESEHYAVHTTASYRRGRELADALEWMHGEFQRRLELASPSGRRPVHVLPGIEAYNNFGDENAGLESSVLGGFWAAGYEGRPIVTYDDGNLVQLKMWATHAAFLEYEGTATPKTERPVWLVRGLASYFSLLWDFDYGVAQFRELRAAGRLRPLSALSRENLEALARDPHARFVELGMLCSYLMHFREDTRDVAIGGRDVPGPFSEWLAAYFAGEDLADSEITRLLTRDIDELQADFFACEFGR